MFNVNGNLDGMVQLFENPEFGKLRGVMVKGVPHVVAKDVCEILGIKSNSDALRRLDDDQKGTVLNDTLGGKQKMNVINESGFYSLVLSSRKPIAKPFQRWVAHEVLPAIRKHGIYATPQTAENILNDPDVIIAIMQNFKKERRLRERLEAQAELNAPKVAFATALEVSDDTILVREMAKLLKQKYLSDLGGNQFYEFLRNEGYLIKAKGSDYNLPTQRSIDAGWMVVREGTRSSESAETGFKITKTTKITTKGQKYFFDLFYKKTLVE